MSKLSKFFFIFMLIMNLIAFLDIRLLSLYRKILYLNIPILLMILFSNRYISKKKYIRIKYSFIVIILSLMSLLVNKGGIGSLVNLAYSYLIILIIMNIEFSKKDLKKLTVCFFIIILGLLAKIFLSYNGISLYSKKNINPNVMAYILMLVFLLFTILVEKNKNKYLKFVEFILFLISIKAILQLEARTSLIILILSFIFEKIMLNIKYVKKILNIKFFYWIMIAGGVIFPIIYLNLFEYKVNIQLLGGKKSFYSGREIVWRIFFDSLINFKRIVFGLGSKFNIVGFDSMDMHNNYLGMISNFGTIGFILYYVFIYNCIKEKLKLKDLNKNVIIGVFICTFLLGYFEGTIYFPASYIIQFMFLALMDDEIRKGKE